jgi:hypothetical protein
MDGNTNLHYPTFPGALHVETVTLYGPYGNNEQTSYQEAVATTIMD